MPRPRKPTAVLEATGAFAKNPSRKRARADEPIDARPIGDPPDYFDAGHTAAWHELCAQAQPGVLARSDSAVLELTTRLLVRMRRSPSTRPRWLGRLGEILRRVGWAPDAVEDLEDTVLQAIKITPGELRVLSSCLTNLGMTPLNRIPGRTVDSAEEDPLMQLLGTLPQAS